MKMIRIHSLQILLHFFSLLNQQNFHPALGFGTGISMGRSLLMKPFKSVKILVLVGLWPYLTQLRKMHVFTEQLGAQRYKGTLPQPRG